MTVMANDARGFQILLVSWFFSPILNLVFPKYPQKEREREEREKERL